MTETITSSVQRVGSPIPDRSSADRGGGAWLTAPTILLVVALVMLFVPVLNSIAPALAILGAILLVRESRNRHNGSANA